MSVIQLQPHVPELRTAVEGLPTSFSLPVETVDRLREVGDRLLRQSGSFRQFRADFEQEGVRDLDSLIGGASVDSETSLYHLR